MTEMETLRQRIMQLEELFSHQEHLVQHLNEAIVQLRADLRRVELKSADQEHRLQWLADSPSETRDSADDKPPHY